MSIRFLDNTGFWFHFLFFSDFGPSLKLYQCDCSPIFLGGLGRRFDSHRR